MFNLHRLILFYRSLFLTIGGLVVSLILIVLVLFPAVSGLRNLYKALPRLETEVAELEVKANLLAGVDPQVLQQNLLVLTSALPTEKSLPTILSTVEGVAGKTGATVVSIDLQGPGSLASESAVAHLPTSKFPAQRLTAEVMVRGEVEQLKEYLGLISKVRRLLTVAKFGLNTTNPANATLSLSVNAYYGALTDSSGALKLTPLSTEEENILSIVENLPSMSTFALTPAAPLGQVRDNPFAP